MTLKSDVKFGEKLTFGNASSGKSENLPFDKLLLSKAYYVWTKKVQRSYFS